MGFRSSLAAVLASVLFAGAWAACDQLGGFGVGGSSAVAGVLAIVAFALTLLLTRSDSPGVGRLRSERAKPNGLRGPVGAPLPNVYAEPDARPGGLEHGLPETHGTTAKAREAPTGEYTGTLVTQQVQFIVDGAGMQVRGKRKTIGGEVWEEYLRIQWSAVTAIGFAIERYDPVVALYAWAAVGRPAHVTDSRLLSHSEWAELAELIAGATRGRLTLDPASRRNPRSVWPE